jgi:hypothetical protein
MKLCPQNSIPADWRSPPLGSGSKPTRFTATTKHPFALA